jgi:hypothetical protein
MPPRHVYWTIIYGGQATSFRAATRDELLPTLRQLQSRHPDAALKFFARGRIWDTEEEARQRPDSRHRHGPPHREAWRGGRDRESGGQGRRPVEDKPNDRREGERAPAKHTSEGERRGKNWRPGGQHRDPRDRWKVPRDVKRKRFAQRQRWQASADGKNPEGKGTGPRQRRPPASGTERPGGSGGSGTRRSEPPEETGVKRRRRTPGNHK